MCEIFRKMGQGIRSSGAEKNSVHVPFDSGYELDLEAGCLKLSISVKYHFGTRVLQDIRKTQYIVDRHTDVKTDEWM